MDLHGAHIGGGLFRIRGDAVSFSKESSLSLTNVSLNVEIADTTALFEVHQTFNNQGDACDVWYVERASLKKQKEKRTNRSCRILEPRYSTHPR